MPEHLQPDLLTQTPKDIIALTMDTCAKLTAPLGNTALGVVVGSEAWKNDVLALDAAAVTGDLEATKVQGRKLITTVKEMITKEL
jgi:hypothetical protein